MNIQNIASVFCGLLLAACTTTTTPTFKVTVDMDHAEGAKVYLQKVTGQEIQTLDSAQITEGTAMFNTPVSSDNEMYSILMENWRRPVSFFTDNKDVTVSGDREQPYNLVIAASETQARLEAFKQGYQAFDKQLDSIGTLTETAKTTGDTALFARLKSQYADKEVEQKMYCFNYVWDNKSDVVAHYVLYNYKWAFTTCEIHNMIDNLDTLVTSSNLERAKVYVTKLDRVETGQPLIDFTQNDTAGNPVTLSKLAANTKLLLVDFWASWCPDCRKENPNVVTVYNHFHEQGFDVLGVSYDKQRKAWLQAIKTDGLTWTHVSDLQGWSNATAEKYAIAFIPQNILLKDGLIVGRNLNGDELMQEVERLLKD